MSHVIRWYTGSRLGNYNHLLVSDVEPVCVVVDPFYPEQTIEETKKIGKEIAAILVTHEHADHYQGSKPLADQLDIPIYAHASNVNDIPRLDVMVKEGDCLSFAKDLNLQVIETPGHLKGHVCFYSEKDQYVITGDVLFNAGIGRVAYRSSDIAKLYESVMKLSQLPNETTIYPAHDYYISNLSFMKSIDHGNDKMAATLSKLESQTPETRSMTTIAEEKEHNFFMRADEEIIAEKVGEAADIINLKPGLDTFIQLRKLRDQW